MMATLARQAKWSATPFQKRQRIEAVIDQLVALLDAMDGDPDFEDEPDLEPDSDLEPWLGWNLEGDRVSGETAWDMDREVDEDFEGEAA